MPIVFFSIYIFLITYLSRLYYTPCDVLREYTVFDRQSVNPLNCFCKGNSLIFLYGISRSFVRNKDTLCRCVYYLKITVLFILQQFQHFCTRTFCHLLSVVMNSLLAVLLNRCTEFLKVYMAFGNYVLYVLMFILPGYSRSTNFL